MTVDGCNHTNCPFAVPARRSIDEKISQGMGKEAIIQSFVAQYGEVVLAAPTKTGFNLTAWVLPFVAILAGAGIVRAVIKRWARPGAHPARESEGLAAAEDDIEYRARVEKELKELDR
jgi:cytochrome c-type biogenesis protein CcmH